MRQNQAWIMALTKIEMTTLPWTFHVPKTFPNVPRNRHRHTFHVPHPLRGERVVRTFGNRLPRYHSGTPSVFSCRAPGMHVRRPTPPCAEKGSTAKL